MSQPQEIRRPTERATSASSGVPLEQQILEEQIRSRAYGLYLLRGGEEGHEVEDWLRAEEEISQKAA
jgi:Protein of unknown function (DUF2934)